MNANDAIPVRNIIFFIPFPGQTIPGIHDQYQIVITRFDISRDEERTATLVGNVICNAHGAGGNRVSVRLGEL